MTLEQLAALSAIGKAMLALFAFAWLGAAVSFFVLLRPHLARFASGAVWFDAEVRWRFLIVVGFCALGLIAVLGGVSIGGWPQGSR